ncbi:hypothetical protein FZX09_06125 [Synechococcus sp. MU1643]|nr:hypothetical protein [Synechococcus sp. MU1643]
MLARRWPSGLRLPLAAMALLLFVCLAGAQPSVVRAVLMAAIALLIRESGQSCWGAGVDAHHRAAALPRLGSVDRLSTQCCRHRSRCWPCSRHCWSVGPRGASGCAAHAAVARPSVGGHGDDHGQLDQPLAWRPTAHRTSRGVGGCLAGARLVALVAGSRALLSALVAAPHGNRPARPWSCAARR